MEKNKIPYVMINANYPDLTTPKIAVDDVMGGKIATEHLLSLDHKRILGIFKTDDLQGVNRLKGYIQAHRDRGLIPSPEMILIYSTEEIGEILPNKVKSLLKKGSGERPTGIVCYNDEMALLILNLLRNLALNVPEDMSIVGYDDSSLATLSDIKLTTVTHPKQKLGEAAAKAIVDWIETHQPMKESILFEPELVIRQSTRELKITKN